MSPMGEVVMLGHEPLVTAAEVAQYLKVTIPTVHKWSNATVDPLPVRKYGFRGFRRFRMSEVDAWLERRKNA
jgi:predicted DNA-binding transcriptional regulator AlpA